MAKLFLIPGREKLLQLLHRVEICPGKFCIRASPRDTILFCDEEIPFTLGAVGHFGLAVRDPKKSARWFERALGLEKQFEFDDGVAVGNDHVTIALHKGKPSPRTIGHMSFHLPNMATLKKALAHLQKVKVALEDPGDEIGPEAEGSNNMGLWFHDPDGYRWELSVQAGSNRPFLLHLPAAFQMSFADAPGCDMPSYNLILNSAESCA